MFEESQSVETTEEAVPINQEIIKSISIENLLSQRNAILERFEQMQVLAEEIKQLTKALQYEYPPHFEWEYSGRRHAMIDQYHNETEESRKEYRQAIDALSWRLLMKESGNLSFMDAKARAEWDEGLKKEVPELTPANIQATFKNLHGSRQDMFHRGVINVFKGLSWNYKTNSPFKFGKRIIIGYINSWHSHSHDKLDDLTRVFCMLDGKPEPEYRQRIAVLIGDAKKKNMSSLETPYFHLKWFLNGNGHCTFTRLDLVEKLNRIVATAFPFHLPQDN